MGGWVEEVRRRDGERGRREGNKKRGGETERERRRGREGRRQGGRERQRG